MNIYKIKIDIAVPGTITIVYCICHIYICIIYTLDQCLSQEWKKVRHMSHQAEKGETHVSPS